MRVGKVLSCTAEFKIRFSRVVNDTIGHSIPVIHLISGGMIQDFRCSMNAPGKRAPQMNAAHSPANSALFATRNTSALVVL